MQSISQLLAGFAVSWGLFVSDAWFYCQSVLAFWSQSDFFAAYAYFMMVVGSVSTVLGAIDVVVQMVDRIRDGRRRKKD